MGQGTKLKLLILKVGSLLIPVEHLSWWLVNRGEEISV